MNRADALRLSAVRAAAKDGTARVLREEAGLTQTEVASVCQVTPAAISRWEDGLRTPRGPAALRYARLLECLQGQRKAGAA